MSENPIIKHALKGYKAWKAPGVKVHKRIIEIAIEMAIIVFAITLSMALERWRDNINKNDIEKQFFVSYKGDLIRDINELKADSASYYKTALAFSYFLNNEKYSQDSIRIYYPWFSNVTEFVPNISRFEALKSSGNLDVIRNKHLLDDIVSLYSEDVPELVFETHIFSHSLTEFIVPYLDNHLKYDKSNLEGVLHTDITKNYLKKKGAAIWATTEVS